MKFGDVNCNLNAEKQTCHLCILLCSVVLIRTLPCEVPAMVNIFVIDKYKNTSGKSGIFWQT